MIAGLGGRLFRKDRDTPAGQADPDYPAIAAGVATYVVGDIHGRIDLLRAVQAAIDADCALAGRPGREVYLGDYVDRGEHSAAVLDCLIERERTHGAVCLAGNHEQLLLEALTGRVDTRAWYRLGGRETLRSYGLNPADIIEYPPAALAEILGAVVPAAHAVFLRSLALWHRVGGYVIVHAGIRHGVALEDQDRNDLLWIREPFLSCRKDYGFIVIHGHTPVPAVDFRENRINIDTGAFVSNRLTCLKIDASGPTILTPA